MVLGAASTHRDILCGLAVVLQDDGDIHVDDDEEADDKVGEQVGDGDHGVAAVPLVPSLRIRCKLIDIRNQMKLNTSLALRTVFYRLNIKKFITVLAPTLGFGVDKVAWKINWKDP